MGILSTLEKIGRITQAGAAIAPLVLPQAAPSAPVIQGIANAVTTAVAAAEQAHGPGNGNAKLCAALQAIEQALPPILASTEVAANKEIVDQQMLAVGVHDLTEAIVKIQNALRLLPGR